METGIGIIILIWEASNFFKKLNESLNAVCGVKTKSSRPILTLIRERFLSYAMIMGLSFLLLVSMLYSIALNNIYTYFYCFFSLNKDFIYVSNFIFNITMITLTFAAIFKVLTDVK